jgi:hypothetical protein|tara:strand:+ start:745 stop:1260 length:516 start_codon:yes stop_codon:yes gene_type:complete
MGNQSAEYGDWEILARQYAQNAARHLPQFRAKHPSKSTKAWWHLGQESVRIVSTTCSFAARSFSVDPALDARSRARFFSSNIRSSISFRIASATLASRIPARLRKYPSKVVWDKFAATSLSDNGAAVHRSDPPLAVFRGQRHRPSGSRFLISPTGFSISLLTYISKQSPHV